MDALADRLTAPPRAAPRQTNSQTDQRDPTPSQGKQEASRRDATEQPAPNPAEDRARSCSSATQSSWTRIGLQLQKRRRNSNSSIPRPVSSFVSSGSAFGTVFASPSTSARGNPGPSRRLEGLSLVSTFTSARRPTQSKFLSSWRRLLRLRGLNSLSGESIDW